MKSDWNATFRNWIRRAEQFGKLVYKKPVLVENRADVLDMAGVPEKKRKLKLSMKDALKKFGE